jgi:cell division protein FtsB
MFRSDAKQRIKSDLLGLSITEVLLILIFVLLAYTHFAEIEMREEVELKEAQVEKLQVKVDELERENSELKRSVRKLKKERDEMRHQYRAVLVILRKYLSTSNTLTPVEIEEQLERLKLAAESAHGGVAVVMKRVKQLQTKISKLNRQVANLQNLQAKNRSLQQTAAKAKSLQAQNVMLQQLVSNMKRASGGKGTTRPRCVIPGQSTAIPFLYEIWLYPSHFVVKPLWSPAANLLFEAIPGITDMGFGRIGDVKFRSAGREIYAWGDKQTPACRFFANVHNRAGDKLGIVEGRLKLVEGPFYVKRMWRR